MNCTLLALGLALLAVGDPETKTPRKPSTIAPSLPALTKEEEEKLDEIVERLIRADTGRLRGEAARKAIKEFETLKPEAIPAMIRGLNKSARLNYTCPVLLISRKLSNMLLASNDPILLEYARDEIGAGVGRSKYAAALQDLRVKCSMRRNYLARTAPPPPKGLAALSTSQLAKAANTERGPKLKGILTELAKRSGKEVLPALAVAADSYEKDTKKLGQTLLDGCLERQSASVVLEKLGDDAVEIRKSAIRVAARHPTLIAKIIDRLTDDNAEVRAEARGVLVKLAKGTDFGPSATASRSEQDEARKKWSAWWERQSEKR
jgi:hypothetical protein